MGLGDGFDGSESDLARGPHLVDVVVVGAGFAGLYSVYRLRQLGYSTIVLESAPSIGGTWYHNRYPGARCDIESLDYSFSFDADLQQEWRWSERYAAQPEILRYMNHVADRFDLWRDIQLNTRVVSADFDEGTQRWTVTTENGESFSAQFCIMATGVLSAAQVPAMPGLDTFSGEWFHTADWPLDPVDFSSRRVGVIGTGSSGTQLIPIVADQAAQLTVFQRTANYCMPAQNRPLDERTDREWKANYPERRAFARQSSFGHNQIANPLNGADVSAAERAEEFQRRWDLGGLYMMRAFKDIMVDADVNAEAVAFVHRKIDEIIDDPATAEALKPRDLYIGTKRLCSGTNYYETFNLPHVRLVDVKADPIVEITPTGIRTQSNEFELDVIVFATGFDAMTGSVLRIDPRGRGGQRLSDKWSSGPKTYLGISVNGFPNMFIVAGAGSPSVFSNMVNSIEQHVEWITRAIDEARKAGIGVLEASAEAESDWVAHVNELAERTLYGKSRKTWFYGANTPGKAQVFMPYVGGVGNYATRLSAIADDGYHGFETQPESTPTRDHARA
ncbi:MAG: NAD(P)/FAD-dependent oxidoreductase [Microbacterium sp.]|uniref:flavin-containing monooxygenase n=1 Tax=Microbacterium sp. TaxID=51671 RepID=UPI0027239DEF|nr:NAD(P)/FAD-dependent oxidoreductase [Microbacterium sp.]MDO8382591.1 NAD(P)/FAD-dependent oxidoreductase [Microbacterium sp.]